MNIIVHLLFAHAVRRAVMRQGGARLSLAGFLLGNVLPDLSARYRAHPHFLSQSQDFVLARTAALGGEWQPAGSFARAKDIGVVTHYLSDYCCYAHTDAFGADMRRHHLYEMRMLFDFSAGLSRFEDGDVPVLRSPAEFRGYLARCLEEEQSAVPCGRRDVFYALTLSASAAALLTRADVPAQSAYIPLPADRFAF